MALSLDSIFRSLAPGATLLALACSAGSAVPDKPAAPFMPTLSLRPVFVGLTARATQLFQAEFNEPVQSRYQRPPIGWRVVEPSGGTILTTGLYTAPANPGIYHVQVRREDFPEITAVATVTVK